MVRGGNVARKGHGIVCGGASELAEMLSLLEPTGQANPPRSGLAELRKFDEHGEPSLPEATG